MKVKLLRVYAFVFSLLLFVDVFALWPLVLFDVVALLLWW